MSNVHTCVHFYVCQKVSSISELTPTELLLPLPTRRVAGRTPGKLKVPGLVAPDAICVPSVRHYCVALRYVSHAMTSWFANRHMDACGFGVKSIKTR